MNGEMAVAVAGTLATYLVHSTVLLGAAAVLGRWAARTEAWRETLWKAALVGAALTTAVQALAPWWPATRLTIGAERWAAQPAAGVEAPAPDARNGARERAGAPPTAATGDEVAAGSPAQRGVAGPEAGPREGDAAASGEAGPAASPGEPARVAGLQGTAGGAQRAEAAGGAPRPTGDAQGAGAAASRDAAAAFTPVQIAALAVTGWAAIALLLLARLGWRHGRLLRVLRGRRVVSEGAVASMLAELRRTAGVWAPVRLTTSPAIASPLVLGQREICVPERFATELGPAEQRAALAHELAHLARRDPAWQLAALVLERVFFFQPLHRLARRRLRESAEYLADGWAVRHGGGRLDLARCLAEVAAWVSPSGEASLAGTVAMAEGGSPLLNRVKRLLEREPESVPRPAARAAAAAALVVAAAAFAPAVGPVSARQEGRGGTAGAAPVQERDVLRAPAGPLSEGLQWAARHAAEAGAREYWIAYAVNSRIPAGRQVSMDSGPWEMRELTRPAVAERLGMGRELSSGGETEDAVILAHIELGDDGSRLARLALRTPSLGIQLDGPIYWLGRADEGESRAWLEHVYESERQIDLRETAVDAISVHPSEAARAFLVRVIETEREPALREQAVEGLEYHPSEATVALLSGLARADAQRAVREEATEALGSLPDPGAVPALAELARGGPDPVVREEAIEGLAQRRDTTIARILLEIALGDPDIEMRRQAVEGMGELPTAVALPLLRRVIAESPDDEVVREAVETAAEFPAAEAQPLLEEVMRGGYPAEVRREALEQLIEMRGAGAIGGEELLELALSGDAELRREAVERMVDLPAAEAVPLLRRVALEAGEGEVGREAAESLGEIGTDEALAALDEIVARNRDEEAAFQAVEAIAENFPRDKVIPRLERILREHPSRRVRREALDRLADLAQGPPAGGGEQSRDGGA